MPVYVMVLFLMIGALILTLVPNGMNLLQLNNYRLASVGLSEWL